MVLNSKAVLPAEPVMRSAAHAPLLPGAVAWAWPLYPATNRHLHIIASYPFCPLPSVTPQIVIGSVFTARTDMDMNQHMQKKRCTVGQIRQSVQPWDPALVIGGLHDSQLRTPRFFHSYPHTKHS